MEHSVMQMGSDRGGWRARALKTPCSLNGAYHSGSREARKSRDRGINLCGVSRNLTPVFSFRNTDGRTCPIAPEGRVPCENRVELDGPNQFCLRTRTFCLARRALSSAVSSEERSDDNPDAAGGRTWGRSPAKTASSLTAPISSAFVLEPSALLDGPLAQRLEQGTHNPLVAGSNPAGPTTCERWWAPGMRTWFRRSERKRAEMGPPKGEGAAPSEASQSCRANH